MDSEKFAHYLKTLGRTLNVPIAYGTCTGEINLFQPFSIISAEKDIGFISGRLQPAFDKFPDKSVMYCITSHLVMLGMVKKHKTGEFVFVGPLASASTTEREIARYLRDSGLSADTTFKLSKYMNNVKNFSQGGLVDLLSNINTVMNDDICQPYEIVAVYDNDTPDSVAFAQKEYALEAVSKGWYDSVTETYNKKLEYCISNGDLGGLSDLINELGNGHFIDTYYTESLAESRVDAYGSIFALEAAALRSGIPSAELEKTKRFYLRRISLCASAEELRDLLERAAVDFTRLAGEYLASGTGNPVINRSIEYIKNNITKKLAAKDIAAALNITEHYLFTNMKKETGRTLTQYINEEKIKKSCYYLQFTDKPLAEIAAFLSFSSQSYFQSVFKKIMGQTPSDWRRANSYSK